LLRAVSVRPSLSLCIIARDEERFLGSCLASVRGVVDEIVLVDTGSNDRTIEIARRAGARVVQSSWADDFAAARNVALDHARGEFVLQLDADEVLVPSSAATIRSAVEEAGEATDAFLLPIHDAAHLGADLAAVVAGCARLGEPQSPPRLFARRAGVRYEGAIHEGIDGWLAARGLRVRGLDAPIVHFGRVPEIVAARGKRVRNHALLRAACAREPGFLWHGYLAVELLDAASAGDPSALAEAKAVVEDGWVRLRRGEGAPHHSALRLAVARAVLALREGRSETVLETVEAAEARDGIHRDLCFLRGQAHELAALSAGTADARVAATDAAREAYAQARSLRTMRYVQAYVPDVGTTAATRLGNVELIAGRPDAAARAFEEILRQRPGDPDATIGRAEASLLARRPDLALSLLASALEAPAIAETADAWTIAARAAWDLGARSDFERLLSAARARVGHRWLAPHRKRRLLELLSLAKILAGSPSTDRSPTGALGALIARVPFAGEASATYPEALALLDGLVPIAVRSAASSIVEALLTPRAEGLVPGIHEAIRTIARRHGWSIEDDGALVPVVVVSEHDGDAKLVASILAAHPRFVAEAPAAILGPAPARLAGGGRRPILALDGEGARRIAENHAVAVVEIDRGGLARDLRGEVARLLALLGEPWSDRIFAGETEDERKITADARSWEAA
jgi:tetratricopeptide (TPR) repeat protein